MNQLTIKPTSARARIPQQECHGKDCASGARNNYYLGKHLSPESYLLEQRYAIERRRLINRAVHGWGVVYGFALSTEDPGGHSGELQIGEGLALDELGRELIQVHPTWVSLDNLVMLDDNDLPVRQDGSLNDRFKDDKCGDECWLLSAHYAEKSLDHKTVSDPCRCDRVEWDRICETVVYSLKRIDCKECCKPWECKLECCCPPETDCCGQAKLRELDDKIVEFTRTYEEALARLGDSDPKQAGPEIRRLEDELERRIKERNDLESKRHGRGGCSCLCQHLAKEDFGVGCPDLEDVGDCTRADLRSGIGLACLNIAKDHCGNWTVGSVTDACGPRQLVKRNDLLFDLINGCDATTIVRTGWAKWHRRSTPPVPFDEFAKALGWKKGENPAELATSDFWVEFSRPVLAATLAPDAFVFAVTTDEGDDFWRRCVRVPVLAVYAHQDPKDPPNWVRKATLAISADWLEDAMRDKDHMFARGETRIEIEVRGDLITDCLGQQVDANSRGRSPFPSGNGSPGGSYFSSFTVAKRAVRERTEQAPKPPKVRQQTPPAPDDLGAIRIG